MPCKPNHGEEMRLRRSFGNVLACGMSCTELGTKGLRERKGPKRVISLKKVGKKKDTERKTG